MPNLNSDSSRGPPNPIKITRYAKVHIQITKTTLDPANHVHEITDFEDCPHKGKTTDFQRKWVKITEITMFIKKSSAKMQNHFKIATFLTVSTEGLGKHAKINKNEKHDMYHENHGMYMHKYANLPNNPCF